MNTRTSTTLASSTSRVQSSRAQFSPVIRRTAQTALTRNRLRDAGGEARNTVVPRPESLTPETPAPTERWWDPHLVDRLQLPLTRFRD